MKTKFIFIAILLITSAFNFIIAQNQVAAFKSEAQKQMQVGRYGEAIDLLNRYVSARPKEAAGFNLRGLCYEKRGQYEMAVYDFRSARKLEPTNREINENLSRATNDWYKLLYNKIEGHRREIALNPNKASNYLEIGKSYKNLGEWALAEEWYDQYLLREKASPDEIIRYSEILAKNGHIAKGEPILKRYTEEFPTDQRLWSRYGYFTLWLGKNKIAIEAFENALEIKPFFKEAMDGLDQARGKGYIYTVNDTSVKHTYGIAPKPPVYEYAIDRYYRILRRNPGDVSTRFKLVEELVNVKRFEEAYNQLQILAETQSGNSRFIDLWENVTKARNDHYAAQIDKYKAELEADPYNKESTLKLAEYYAYMKEYDTAMDILKRYLQMRPEDQDVSFRLAQYAQWNKDYALAKEILDGLLYLNPNKTDYQLLRAQIAVWSNEDLDRAQTLLESVIRKDPQNIQALITMGMLNFQKQDYVSAQKYLSTAKNIDPNDADVKQLQFNLDLQKERDREAALYSILEEARKEVFEENCSRAIELYNSYLNKTEASAKVWEEIAQAYICAKDYDKAVQIYSDLIEKNNTFELRRQRAKVYYWAGDSLQALQEFEKLVTENPEDVESRIYLGDSYMAMKNYDKAYEIYDKLLTEYPSSQIIQMRMDWLGKGEPGLGYPGEFPTYFLISPEASYFADNLKFRYDLQGLRVEMGVTSFLAIGVSAFRGGIENEADRLNLSVFRGHVYGRISKLITAYGSLGQTIFSNNKTAPVIEASLRAEKAEKFLAGIYYTSSDAVQILYSPYLVTERLRVHDFTAKGYYHLETGLFLSGKNSYLNVSDGNSGNNFELRVGKTFEKDFRAGYEYYYLNFNNRSILYWSPANYQSHSGWAEWDLISDRTSVITFGGKLGIIPENNYILREIFGAARIKLVEGFTIQARLATGSTVQQRLGYSSTSFGIAAFWTF